MIVQIIENSSQFRNKFYEYGRGSQFSYQALGLLFDYLDNIHDENCYYELDVIAICCEYVEMEENEVRSCYSLEPDEDIEDYLSEHTAYIGKTPKGYLFSKF